MKEKLKENKYESRNHFFNRQYNRVARLDYTCRRAWLDLDAADCLDSDSDAFVGGLFDFGRVVFGQAEGGFGSLADVMQLFTNKNAALAGWIHYLAFDLFVGSWEVKDAQERGVSHWFVVPCLFLTFLLGPIGFLAYHAVRLIAARGETK